MASKTASGSATPTRYAAIVVLLAAALLVGPAVRAHAQAPWVGASQGFCTALLDFDTHWPQVNLDFAGQPFFNDGNNDGIADLLQIGHAKLPSLASGLDALAGEAPSDLQRGLRTMASDARTLAKQAAPTTASQSSREAKPIETVASGVQRDLKATNCLGRVTAANAAADAAADGSSATGDDGRTAAAVILFLLVNLPLIRRVWRHARKPAVNADGSRFKGNLRRWKTETTTGRVLNVQRESVTRAFAGGPVDAAGYVPVSSTTTTTETVRLGLADGSQRDVALVNFSAFPSGGDLVTICLGHKRSRVVAFAVLNHTTRSQIVQLQNLFSLREGGTVRQVLFVFGLIFGALATAFIAVFIGAPWLLAVWLVLVVLFVVGSRREASIDLKPLWRRASAEVEPLRA
jgi:hypothetical protein